METLALKKEKIAEKEETCFDLRLGSSAESFSRRRRGNYLWLSWRCHHADL